MGTPNNFFWKTKNNFPQNENPALNQFFFFLFRVRTILFIPKTPQKPKKQNLERSITSISLTVCEQKLESRLITRKLPHFPSLRLASFVLIGARLPSNFSREVTFSFLKASLVGGEVGPGPKTLSRTSQQQLSAIGANGLALPLLPVWSLSICHHFFFLSYALCTETKYWKGKKGKFMPSICFFSECKLALIGESLSLSLSLSLVNGFLWACEGVSMGKTLHSDALKDSPSSSRRVGLLVWGQHIFNRNSASYFVSLHIFYILSISFFRQVRISLLVIFSH